MNISRKKITEDERYERLRILRECAVSGGLYLQYFEKNEDGFLLLPGTEQVSDEFYPTEFYELFTEAMRTQLLDQFQDDLLEDVIISNLPAPRLQAGICVRDANRDVSAVIILQGIDRDAAGDRPADHDAADDHSASRDAAGDHSAYHDAEDDNSACHDAADDHSADHDAAGDRPAYRLTDMDAMNMVIRVVTDLMYQQKQIQNKSREMQGTLEDVRERSDHDRQMLERNSVMTEILGQLESEDEFLQVAEQVLALAAGHLGVTEAGLLRIDPASRMVDMIAEYAVPSDLQMKQGIQKWDKERLPFFTGRPYTISAGAELPDAFRYYFDEFAIRAGAFYPLYTDDVASMYIQFTSHGDRKWNADDLKFLNDVKKVLQSILTKRITRNSLTSSYVTLEAILEHAGCGIEVVDLAHHQSLYANQNLRDAITDPADRENLESIMFLPEVEIRNHHEFHAEHSQMWFDLTFTAIQWVDGRQVRLMTAYDITKLKHYQNRIERQANTDFLTGLKNRKRCEEELADELRRAIHNQAQGAFLYIDMDDFRDINDSLGHAMGDLLLRQVAEQLTRAGGMNSTAYRFGGDEFALLIPARSGREIDAIIHKVQNVFAEPWLIENQEYYCTMSMGVVYFPHDGEDVMTLLKRADIALRTAKHDGKNRTERFNETLPGTSTRRLDMEHAMRRAVEEGCKEFEVYYQPLMDVTHPDHKCCGAEALVRWKSKKLGFVMPSEFVPFAEYLGLIVPIGKHVLFQACRRCKYWNDFGHPEYKINVNMSVVQLLQENIVETVKEALDETGINPSNLTIEITEGLAVHDMKQTAALLGRLRDLGVRVALDDFGTGYSSLSYLRNMPLDVIKIDKCFVDNVGEDQFSDAFVKTVAKLADVIDANVVVEGVEKQDQANVLSTMNVDMIQGYLYDMPLPQDEFEKKYVENA